jgi:CheY-like chemotaxis protein
MASDSCVQSNRHLRVLLVDDNPGMLARASAALASGCEVVGAVNDGNAAIQAAAALHPDVVVLDISMPGMSGFEVAFCLRKAGSTAPVVFLTVHEEEEFVAAAKKAGGDRIRAEVAPDRRSDEGRARSGRRSRVHLAALLGSRLAAADCGPSQTMWCFTAY